MVAGRMVKGLESILARVLKSEVFTIRECKRHPWHWCLMYLGVT